MATTTNYGWTTPDNSGLVKNGAQDIRNLGQSIDTFLYRPLAKNFFYNSAFDIWQRGSTGAGNTTGVQSQGFVADRWQGVRGAAAAGMTMSRQTAQNTALPNVQYAMRMQRDSGNALTQDIRLFYSAETADSIPFAGQTITFSYYVRKGANYSGGDVIGQVYSGTGTDQNLAFAYTGANNFLTVTRTVGTLTTDWTRVQGTATVPATATELALLLYYTPTGTAGANDWIEITGVQLEVGSVATPFKRSSGTIQGETQACRRYLPAINFASGFYTAMGYAIATNTGLFAIPFDTPARVAPTGITIPTVTGNFTVRNSANADAGATTLTFDVGGVNGASVISNGTMVAATPARLISNSGSGYILFTGCEL